MFPSRDGAPEHGRVVRPFIRDDFQIIVQRRLCRHSPRLQVVHLCVSDPRDVCLYIRIQAETRHIEKVNLVDLCSQLTECGLNEGIGNIGDCT